MTQYPPDNSSYANPPQDGYNQPHLPQPYQAGYPQQQGYQQQVVTPKNPAISLLLSFLLPGVGSMVNGDTNKGIGILVGYLLSYLLMLVIIGFITAPIFWVWGMVDAYQGAQRWNARHGIVS